MNRFKKPASLKFSFHKKIKKKNNFQKLYKKLTQCKILMDNKFNPQVNKIELNLIN